MNSSVLETTLGIEPIALVREANLSDMTLEQIGEQCIQLCKRTVKDAWELGRLLNAAEPKVHPGKWKAWIKNHCPGVGYRMACRYRKIAKLDPKTLETVTGIMEAHQKAELELRGEEAAVRKTKPKASVATTSAAKENRIEDTATNVENPTSIGHVNPTQPDDEEDDWGKPTVEITDDEDTDEEVEHELSLLATSEDQIDEGDDEIADDRASELLFAAIELARRLVAATEDNDILNELAQQLQKTLLDVAETME